MVKKEVMLFGEFFVIILTSLLHISIAGLTVAKFNHRPNYVLLIWKVAQYA